MDGGHPLMRPPAHPSHCVFFISPIAEGRRLVVDMLLLLILLFLLPKGEAESHPRDTPPYRLIYRHQCLYLCT